MNNIKEAIAGYIGVIIFVILVILGLYIFSYLLIIGALIGLVLYTITFIRLKFFSHPENPTRKTDSPRSKNKTGRTIDHNPNE